jgi:hypothetical protein
MIGAIIGAAVLGVAALVGIAGHYRTMMRTTTKVEMPCLKLP